MYLNGNIFFQYFIKAGIVGNHQNSPDLEILMSTHISCLYGGMKQIYSLIISKFPPYLFSDKVY